MLCHAKYPLIEYLGSLIPGSLASILMTASGWFEQAGLGYGIFISSSSSEFSTEIFVL